MPDSSFFSTHSVFTVEGPQHVYTGQQTRDPNHQSYDLCVIEFQDDGSFAAPAQLDRTVEAIERARKENPNGAIVFLFIHGWHHNAEWNRDDGSGDSNFSSFRQILLHLTLRESERYFDKAGGRRVVGIYLGWSGKTDGILEKLGPLKNLSFWDRYGTAEEIGRNDPLRTTIAKIVAATKDPLENVQSDVESPLILTGHSMGALMLESAFLSLLKAEDQPLLREPAPSSGNGVTIERDERPFAFPDVLIALNSAADSRIAREILETLEEQKFSKTVVSDQFSYSPPMLISVTSTADSATKTIWRLAQGWNIGRRTDGHDSSLFTHSFERDGRICSCMAAAGIDYGQDWHCLRPPEPPAIPTPSFPLDLPVTRRSETGDYQHERWYLRPLDDGLSSHLAWIFQVPEEIMEEHNDIFNFKSMLLVLAMIQISGATMSLAEDWGRNFEREW